MIIIGFIVLFSLSFLFGILVAEIAIKAYPGQKLKQFNWMMLIVIVHGIIILLNGALEHLK